jgi:nucleotide-binding universal stress UspA family protein
MTFPPPVPEPLHVVLAAVDTSPASELVVRQAAAIAAARGRAILHLVHILEAAPTALALGSSPLLVPSQTRLAQRAWARIETLLGLAHDLGVSSHGHLAQGDPQTKILQLATDLEADLLVVGTHDPGKVAHMLFGSLAEELVRKAPCPVLVVRPRRDSHPDVPEIEPPCPDCLATRARTGGQLIWCEPHREHHPPMHTYHELPEPFAVGSILFRP